MSINHRHSCMCIDSQTCPSPQRRCSNMAITFAFLAFIIGIVPQTTCSFLSINPAEVLRYPNVWPPQIVIDMYPNSTRDDLIDMILNGTIPVGGDVVDQPTTTVADANALLSDPKKLRRLVQDFNPFADRLSFAPTFIGQDHSLQHRQEDDERHLAFFEDLLEDGRNITETNFTIHAGLWRYGVFQIDGKCYPMGGASETIATNVPPPEPSLKAARAMAIIASVSGFAGVVLAMSNCHMDDKTRRRRNKYVAVLYMLAALSTWLTFLIHNITACQGKQRRWDEGPLEGLVLLYGKCQCRVGCFLTIVAGCCYLIAVVTVLIYSG